MFNSCLLNGIISIECVVALTVYPWYLDFLVWKVLLLHFCLSQTNVQLKEPVWCYLEVKMPQHKKSQNMHTICVLLTSGVQIVWICSEEVAFTNFSHTVVGITAAGIMANVSLKSAWSNNWKHRCAFCQHSCHIEKATNQKLVSLVQSGKLECNHCWQ